MRTTKSLKPRTGLGFSACKAMKVSSERVSPPKLGGVAASEASRRGGSLAETFQECISETFRLWNHPVRAFGASTPPNLGGDTPTGRETAFRNILRIYQRLIWTVVPGQEGQCLPVTLPLLLAGS